MAALVESVRTKARKLKAIRLLWLRVLTIIVQYLYNTRRLTT